MVTRRAANTSTGHFQREGEISSLNPPGRRMEEGRSNTLIHNQRRNEFEVIQPQDGLIIEENEGESLCCPALYMNCTPCRTRVNIVVLILLVFFSAGATIGGFTRPVPNALPPRSNSGDTIAAPGDSGDGGEYTTGEMPHGADALDGGNNGDKNDTPYVVGAYYYPWHGGTFHNREGYLRKKLIPQQAPALGEYDDSRPETITKHLEWSRQANINLWVTSWWGAHRLEDSNIRNVILNHQDLGDMKIALHYETAGRIVGRDLSNVAPDIEYICGAYFSHPNYYLINDRPVLVIYITRQLEMEGILEDVLRMIRMTAESFGHNPFIVGDHVFGKAPDLQDTYESFKLLDAVTNYDVYGSMGRPMRYAGKEPINDYYSEQEIWRRKALENGCRYIPAATPGYNDRGVRLQTNHPPLSRRLTVDSKEGSSFEYQLSKALPLVDPMVKNMILINSFNEWHEDTQLEPVMGASASLPVLMTGGLEYEGYGEVYLDILRKYTTSVEGTNVFKSSGDGL